MKRITFSMIFLQLLLWSTEARGGLPGLLLKEYDYEELALLKISKTNDGSYVACFYGRKKSGGVGRYAWISEKSEISTRNAFVLHICPNYVEIEETVGVNGVDWVSLQFKWPIAHDSQNSELRQGC